MWVFNCIFISFIYENLEVLRNLDSNLKLQYLMSSWDMDKINKCLEKHLDLDILYTEITKERVDFMHSHNLVVNVWTVNDLEKGEYLVDCGVDFITTNILE